MAYRSMTDQKLPPEWDWEPVRLTPAQILRKNLFPRWETIEKADPDPIEQENRQLADMLEKKAELAANHQDTTPNQTT